MELREIPGTGLRVSPVALGCWPIAGMTSVGVTREQSLATIQACLEVGINFLDTAYMYGAEGESERLIRDGLGQRRDEMVIATKCGLHWEQGQRAFDARPETMRRECEESLSRLGTDRVELLYLHAVDPQTPLAETAGGLRRLLDAGKTRSVGVSNLTVEQLDEFAAECPIAAVQPPYNMLQRQIEQDILPWCGRRRAAAIVYWPLMKGLLAGKLPRDHQFHPQDGRAKYPMFHGDEWQRNHDFLDDLRAIAADAGCTIAQLAVRWTIEQPHVTSALCGAKRPDQIRETAAAMRIELSDAHHRQIAAALQRRGLPQVQSAV